MKRCKQCNSCWFITKNIQVDMGAHADFCEVGEEVFGDYGGIMDNELSYDIVCPCYKPKPKKSFKDLNLEKFKEVFSEK